MIKITSRWFPYTSYGTVMALHQPQLLVRRCTGAEVYEIADRRGLFVAASVPRLRRHPCRLIHHQHPLPQGKPGVRLVSPSRRPTQTTCSATGRRSRAVESWFPSGPLFRRRVFWWACHSLAGTDAALRETFNTWIPTYFNESLSMSPGEAADKSALFSLLRRISVLLAGFLSDRLGRVESRVDHGRVFVAGCDRTRRSGGHRFWWLETLAGRFRDIDRLPADRTILLPCRCNFTGFRRQAGFVNGVWVH